MPGVEEIQTVLVIQASIRAIGQPSLVSAAPYSASTVLYAASAVRVPHTMAR